MDSESERYPEAAQHSFGHSRPGDLGDALARDWITIWQSEFAAIAVDREIHESWLALLGVSAEVAMDEQARPSGSVPSPRPAPADAAPRSYDSTNNDLNDRVMALERRLAEFEGGYPSTTF